MQHPDIRVIIPALNEQNAVGQVIREIPNQLVNEIIVVDNGSSDDTFEVARSSGAVALREPRRGYGYACLKGMSYIAAGKNTPDIVVFIDGDLSDYPAELSRLIDPILKGKVDLVLGSRTLGTREKGSMTPQQILGNGLATRLMRLFFNVSYSDLGPFRAIRYAQLVDLGMRDTNYGWTIEMQIKAAKKGLNILEVPVDYRKRIGVSKVSGTVKGTILAGYKIIFTILKYL